MPEHEFEIYLSLLGRLLRLSPAQKAAISDELRDHLEERLNGLIESGLSREQAIRMAIDEFGDLTGLALDLTKASRTPFRKVAVRSTVAASVVAALVVIGVSLFTPEHRLAAPPAVIAQQKPPVTESTAEPPSQLALLQDDELFPDYLRKQIDVDFHEQPLAEVCQQLESMCQVPIRLRQSVLQEEGFDLNKPISLRLTGMTLEEVLNQLVGKLSSGGIVVWQVDGALVQITTEDNARFFTRQFDLHELIKAGHAMRSLIEILQMSGGQWADTDGDGGTLAAVGESLVVRQKYSVLRRIAQVLAVIAKPPVNSELVGNCSGREQLLKTLQQPTEIAVVDVPLVDVVQILSKQQNIALIVDELALQEEGIDVNALVSLTLKNRPLGKLLDDLLNERQLAYQIRNGVIQITTRDRADNDFAVMVYNVSELATSDQTLLQLMRAIFQTTSGRWEAEDGEGGSLARTDVGSVLFVKQTDKVQAQIQLLIEQLKRTWKSHLNSSDKSTVAQPKAILRTYRMPSEVASGISQTLPQLIDQEVWLAAGSEVPSIVVIPVTPRVEGTPAMSTLVIRHTPDAHRQVVKVLKNVGVQFVVMPTETAGTGGLYRGGLGGALGSGGGGMGGGMGGAMGGMGGGGMGGMGGGLF